MFVVLLKFSGDWSQASRLMEGHNMWIKRGIDERAFLVVGSLPANSGGGLIVHGLSREALEAKLQDDPFVAQKIVSPEIIEITPSKTVERLAFLFSK